jgi:hypothetical protein
MRAMFTAIAICMGNCLGTTEVIIITHLIRISCVVFSFFLSPSFSTYPDAIMAKIKRMKRARPVSQASPDTVCWENSIICSKAPVVERRGKERQRESERDRERVRDKDKENQRERKNERQQE